MKVAILAGGYGTRLAEYTTTIPKPMVEIGGNPILWHIMKGYSVFGYHEFVVALGYKGHIIKDYFLNYRYRANSLTVSLKTGEVSVYGSDCEDWNVHLLDTGVASNTGLRVRKVAEYLDNQPFMLTYGDGVADVRIEELIAFHKSHGKVATLTAVRPRARFGEVIFDGDSVKTFNEKPQTGEGWINGGFFVFEPEIKEFIEGDYQLEREPLEKLANEGQLMAYRHDGFWQCMDNLKDVQTLESLWQAGDSPWKTWM